MSSSHHSHRKWAHRDDERVDYSHVVSLKHVGETLDLKVLRSGEVSLFRV
jgi:hypothetical protein